MQSSSESSAEHALVDALRIVFLRHQGRSWVQIKAETGISKGTAQRAVASSLPKTPPATQPLPLCRAFADPGLGLDLRPSTALMPEEHNPERVHQCMLCRTLA